MEMYENKICFELDERTKDTLMLAFRVLGIEEEDGDILFRQFVQYTIRKALMSSRRMEPNYYDDEPVRSLKASYENTSRNTMGYITVNKSPLEKLDTETTKSRILRWSRNKRGFAYKILSIYFKCYDENEQHVVRRSDMIHSYRMKYNESPENFIMTFRQMCSDSIRAYGMIFKYDREEGTVTLNPEYADFIMYLKNEFVC